MPTESRAPGFFATSRDDPRYAQNMAFFRGIASGDIAGALEKHEERLGKKRLEQLGMFKTGLELEALLGGFKKDRAISERLEKLNDEEGRARDRTNFAQQLDAFSADSFGTPSYGDIPMFGMTGAGPASTQPAAEYRPPPPRSSMPPLPVQFSPLMAGGSASEGAGRQPPSALPPQYQRMLKQARIYEDGGRTDMALKLYDAAKQFQPDFATEFRQVVDPATNRLINVQVSKDGTIRPVPYGVKPDISLENLGGQTVAIDKNSTQGGQAWNRTMTPGEVASNRVAQGNLRVAQDRLTLDRDAPQYVATDGGYIALPKRPGPGPIVGQPVMGPDGEPIARPLKPIPASANTAIIGNTQNLRRARQALALLQGGDVGLGKGDPSATGWKGFLPNTVLNRVDPAGVDTRAAIGDLGSMVIHDRSGAAVTAAEFPRLAPFIPLVTDDPATAQKKLERFVQIYQQETDALGEIYSKEQGYRPSPVLENNREGRQPPPVSALPLPPNPTSSSLRTGQTYKLPNGVTATWDGLQFKVKR